MWKEAISLRICFLVELIMESSVEISIAVHNFLPERNSFYANIDARLWDRWWGLAVISRASFPTWSPWAVSWENSHPFLGSAVIGIEFWSNVPCVVDCLAITQRLWVILRFDSIQSEGNVAAADQFFLSHCHADHMKGIDTLAMFLRYWDRYPGSTFTPFIQEKGQWDKNQSQTLLLWNI